MVVGADFHPAKSAEIAFGLIGACAFVEELDRVIDAVRHPTGVQRIPARAFVGVQYRKVGNVITDVGNGIAFVCDDEGKRLATALAHYDDALALARTISDQATVLAVILVVFRFHVATEIRAVDFNDAVKLAPHLLAGHRFAQLVGEDESGLILAVQIAAQLQRGNALRAVHEDDDGGEKIDEAKLAAGEDRAAGDAELVMTGNAFELAAGSNVIGFDTAATRANCLAIGFRPTHIAERLVSAVLAHREHSFEAQRASLCREKKV